MNSHFLAITCVDVMDGLTGSMIGTHIHAGVAPMFLDNPHLSSALDFASCHGLDNMGNSSNKKVHGFILVPISEDTADNFNAVIDKFHKLDIKGILPFYFSKTGLVNECHEPKNEVALDIYGNPDTSLPIEYAANPQEQYKANGVAYTSLELSQLPKIKRVRANCANLFNLASNLSGIDLSRLHEDIPTAVRGHEIAQKLSGLIKKAALIGYGDEFSFYAGDTLGVKYYGCKTNTKKKYSFSKMVKGLKEVVGDDALHHAFSESGSIEMRPLRQPQYLAEQLAKLPEYKFR